MSDGRHLHQGHSILLSLPDGIIGRIASFLPLCEATCNLRPVCKAFAVEVRSEELLSIQIGTKRSPVPSHALLWRWGQLGSCRGLTYKQRVQLLSDAARGGDVDALQQLSHSTGCLVNEEVFRAAARAGQEAVCDWLLGQEIPLKDNGAWVLAVAAEGGHMQLCEKLRRAGFQLHQYTMRLAARAGQGVLPAWVHMGLGDLHSNKIAEAGMPDDLQDECWANAAYAGHVDLMQRLKGSARATPKELPAVAFGCSLAALEEMMHECEQSSAFKSQEAAILAAAASSPTPDWQDKVLSMLRGRLCDPIHTLDRGTAQHFTTLPDAAQRLEWLAGHGCVLRECRQLLRAAVEAGRAELVHSLSLKRGAVAEGPMSDDPYEQLIVLAVENGHLDLAKELHSRGLPVYLYSLAWAAGGTGRVDVAQWAVQLLQEEDEKREAAWAEGGAEAADAAPDADTPGGVGDELERRDMIELTDDNREDYEALAYQACQCGSLELVQWLRKRSADWFVGQVGYAASSGNELMVEWMAEQGYTMEPVSWTPAPGWPVTASSSP